MKNALGIGRKKLVRHKELIKSTKTTSWISVKQITVENKKKLETSYIEQ
jgi:hypothetical protein